MITKFLARLAAIGSVFAMVALLLPQDAGAAADLSKARTAAGFHLTVNISDTGFDNTEYTVATGSPSPTTPVLGFVEFVNNGTKVHSATEVAGSPLLGAFVSCCQWRITNGKGSGPTMNHFDTGGLAPGQAITLGFKIDGDYWFSSKPDCGLAGTNTGNTFNCSTVILHAIKTVTSQPLSGTYPGDTIEQPGVRTNHPDKSSVGKPDTGTVNVSITDDKGYLPSAIIIAPGTVVTWTNNGSKLHDVRLAPSVPARSTIKATGKASPVSGNALGPTYPPDGYNYLSSGGLAPGQTYSYQFNYTAGYYALCNTNGQGVCGGIAALSFGILSDAELDTITQNQANLDGGTQSTMVMTILEVIQCSSVDFGQHCIP